MKVAKCQTQTKKKKEKVNLRLRVNEKLRDKHLSRVEDEELSACWPPKPTKGSEQ